MPENSNNPIEAPPKNSEAKSESSVESRHDEARTQAGDAFREELRKDDTLTKTTNVGDETDTQRIEKTNDGVQATALSEGENLFGKDNLENWKNLNKKDLPPEKARALGLDNVEIFDGNHDGRDFGKRQGEEGKDSGEKGSRSYHDRDVEIDLNGTKVKFDDQDFEFTRKINTSADVSVEHGDNSKIENLPGVGKRTTIPSENGDATVIEDEQTGAIHIRDTEGKYTSMYPGDALSLTNRHGDVIEGAEAQKAFEEASEKFDEVGSKNIEVGGASAKYSNFIQTANGRNLVTVGKDGSVSTATPEELPKGTEVERGEGSDYRATLADGTEMIYQGGDTTIKNPNGSLIEVSKDGKVSEVPPDQADKAGEKWNEISSNFDKANGIDDGFNWMDSSDWYELGKDALALGAREGAKFLADPIGATTDWLEQGYEWANDGSVNDPGDFNKDLKESENARSLSTSVELAALKNTKGETDITYDQNYLDSLNPTEDPNFDWYKDFDSVDPAAGNVMNINTKFGKGIINTDNGDVAVKTKDSNVHVYRADGSIVTNTEKGQIIKGADGTVSYRQGDSNTGYISQGADGATHLEAKTKDQEVKADVSADGRRVETNVNGDQINYDRDMKSASVAEMDIAFDVGEAIGVDALRERAREHEGTTRVDNGGNVAHHDERGDITSDGDGNVTVGDGPGALHAENETEEEAQTRRREEEERGEKPWEGRRQRFKNEDGDKVRADRLGQMNAEQLKSFGLERLEDGSYKHTLTGRTFTVNDRGRAVWNVFNSDGSKSQLELGRQDQPDSDVTHHKTNEDGETATITHDQEHQTQIDLASGQKLDFNEDTNKVDLLNKDGEKESEFDLETGELDTDALKMDADLPGESAIFFDEGAGGWATSTYDGFTNYEQDALESEADNREETARTTVQNLVSAMQAAQNSGNTSAILAAGAAISAAYGLVDSAVAASIQAGDTGAAAAASLLYSSINSANSAHINVTKNVQDQNYFAGNMEGDGSLGKALTHYTGNINNPLIQRAIILKNMGRDNDPLVQQYFNMTA